MRDGEKLELTLKYDFQVLQKLRKATKLYKNYITHEITVKASNRKFTPIPDIQSPHLLKAAEQ
jgi:hypothetical protein